MTACSFVCPFCPLHCDDLDVKELAERCELFATRFASVQQVSGQQLDADNSNDESRLVDAGRWVAEARTIAVTGTIIDLETARAVCDFVSKTDASLSAGMESSDGFSEAFARDGMFSITLGDAASPHQQIVMIGDCDKRLPRLRERLRSAGSVYTWQSVDHLVDRLGRLRLALMRPNEFWINDDPDLVHTLNLCKNESAIVFAVSVGDEIDGQQRPFWSALQGLLRELNRRIRASVLRFDPSMTLRSVAAWSSDGPHRSATAVNVPVELEIRFSPWAISPSAADETLVDQSRSSARRRITIGCSNIQSGSIALGDGAPPESICFMTAMPGIARDGVVIRGDGSVTLPLSRTHDSELPSASATLLRILSR